MSDTRESRANATEKKFLISASTADLVREWARERLKADPHGTGPFGDEYVTSSLYFDNDRLDVFNRRGSFGRAKYRIRQYSGADYVFLERKMRRPSLLVKRRTQVGLDVVASLAEHDVLPGSAGWWFYERVRVRRLGPACRLSYHRTARAIPTPSGLARLTVDHGLRAGPAEGYSLLEPTAASADILPGQAILELKFRGMLPSVFQDFLRTFGLRSEAVSKYRLGMVALGTSPSAADEAEPAASSAVRD